MAKPANITADTERKVVPFKPATRRGFKLRESVNHTWRCIVDSNTTREMLLLSDFWSHISSDLLPYDKIAAAPENGAWYAELLVVAAGRAHATLVELNFVNLPAILTTTPDQLPPGYDVSFKGPERLWAVVRLSDNLTMREGFPSKAEAIDYLMSHATLRQ